MIFTLLAAYLKIRIGEDIDEECLIFMTYRISEGAVLLRDIWDVYQTSMCLSVPLVRLFALFSPDMSYLMLYLRICSVLVQFLTASFCFIVINRYYSKRTAFLTAIAVATILPRSIQSMEYGFNAVIFMVISVLLLFDIWKGKKTDSFISLVLSGISYALAVFAYPTMVITLPVIVYIILFRIYGSKGKSIKSLVIFLGTCAALALIVVIWLLRYMSPNELISNIRGVLDSGDHSGLFSFLQNRKELVKTMIRCVGLFAVPVVLSIPLLRSGKKNAVPYVYIVFMLILIMGLNLTGLRPSGPFGLLERYMVIIPMTVFFIPGNKKEVEVFWLFFIMGIGTYIGALAGTNLGLKENALYLELSLLAFIIYACCEAENTDGSLSRDPYAVFKSAAVALFVFELIFSKAYFVRVDGTKPANIFEKRSECETAILRGIRNYGEAVDSKNAGTEYINSITESDKTYAYIGSESVSFFYFNGELVQPQYNTTITCGHQWVDYYDKNHDLPDYLFIDRRSFSEKDDFYETEFGKEVKNLYNEDSDKTNDLLIILARDRRGNPKK